MNPFEANLRDRLSRRGVVIPAAELAQLMAYFELLVRWNRKINLTALPLDGAPDATIDRLFVEPVVAAALFPSSALTWFDVGSGGGSPAVPMKVLHPETHLTMVESKSRKAAFLREVIRALGLSGAAVAESRFESLVSFTKAGTDVVSVRGVRPDERLIALCRATLKSRGRLLLFQSTAVGSVQLSNFALVDQVRLSEQGAFLVVFEAA